MRPIGPNALDRAIGWVAPRWVRDRVRARAQLALAEQLAPEVERQVGGDTTQSASLDGYSSTGAGGNGSSGWNGRWHYTPTSVRNDLLPVLPDLRGQSRSLVRRNPIAASAINTNVVRAVGTGLALSAQPHRGVLGWSEEQVIEWRRHVHAEFSLWADSPECDYYGELNFYDLQDLQLRTMLESGDGFTVLPDGEPSATMPYRLRLQVLEADRVGNPQGVVDGGLIAAGVRLKPAGGIDAFHVYDAHPGYYSPGGTMWAGKWVQVVGSSGRRRILHHYKKLRPEQPRGVPYLAPVMQLFRDLGTYTDAEIKAAVVSAFLTVFIESDAGTGPAPVFGLGDPATGGGQGAGPAGDEINLGPGAVVGLAKGESAKAVDPTRPNPAFGPFVDAVVDQLGAGLFIGREMLMKKYNTSYVAARAAFLDAWKHLLDMRTRIVRTSCQPIYETWLAEAVAIGRVQAPGFFADPLLRWAYTRAIWNGDSQGSINPKDEVAAYRDAVDARFMTRERAEWELFGTDFTETYDTKKAEHDRLKADGLLPEPKAGAAKAAAAPDVNNLVPTP